MHKIKLWYEKNQSLIQNNNYVLDRYRHLENEKAICSYYDYFYRNKDSENLSIKVNNPEILMSDKINQSKIFISHSSKDKFICDALVKLMEEIGVRESDIIYTSSERHGIPGDDDIFDFLASSLRSGITVFFMLSDNYYTSEYCLNEMGAAWIVQNDFSTFFLPNFNMNIRGVIDKNKKGYKLSSSQDLIRFRNKLIGKYGLEISDFKWEEVKHNFVEKVNSINI